MSLEVSKTLLFFGFPLPASEHPPEWDPADFEEDEHVAVDRYGRIEAGGDHNAEQYFVHYAPLLTELDEDDMAEALNADALSSFFRRDRAVEAIEAFCAEEGLPVKDIRWHVAHFVDARD